MAPSTNKIKQQVFSFSGTSTERGNQACLYTLVSQEEKVVLCLVWAFSLLYSTGTVRVQNRYWYRYRMILEYWSNLQQAQEALFMR